MVWDMVKGNCLNVLEGHSGEVRSVVMTRRGRFAMPLIPSLRNSGLAFVLHEMDCQCHFLPRALVTCKHG